MPSFVLDKFGGIDRRRERVATSDKNSWNLRNLYVDAGRRLQARPGVIYGHHTTHKQLNCDGLLSWDGTLWTFAIEATGAAGASPAGGVILLDSFGGSGAGNTVLKKVWFAEVVGRYPYVVVEYGDGTFKHHYFDGTADTRVTDALCPHTPYVTAAAGRIFCAGVNRDTVVYSGLTTPRIWTAAAGTGGGFLSVSQQQSDVGRVTGMGQFQQDIVVFFENAAQVWFPDPDNAKIVIRNRIYNTGTQASQGIAPFGEDLLYIARQGIRSIGLSTNTNNREEFDIGSPVDEFPLGMAEETAGSNYTYATAYPRYPVQPGAVLTLTDAPIAKYIPSLGTCIAWSRVTEAQAGLETRLTSAGSLATYTAVMVLSYSKTGEISDWASFSIPRALRDFCYHGGLLWALENTAAAAPYSPALLAFSTAAFTDAPQTGSTELDITFTGELGYLDLEKPGMVKQLIGLDIVARGQADYSILHNPNDETLETNSAALPANANHIDTRPEGLTPVELAAVSFAPKFSGTVSQGPGSIAYRLQTLQFYYELLGRTK